jgi:hypothetical protein
MHTFARPLLCLLALVVASPTILVADDGDTSEIPTAPLPPDLSLDTTTATAPPPHSSYEFDSLRHQIARVLATYRRRPLNTLDHTPWEVMHWSLTWGAGATIRQGNAGSDLVRSFEWLNRGGRCNGQVMVATNRGRLIALQGKGMQGHASQYLAVMAQARLPKSTPVTVDGKQFMISHLLETEKRACREGTELTFALIAMSHYLDTDATWKSVDGTTWSLAKLVEEELAQPIHGAACGGTHRLFGLAYACQQRREATGRLDGVYEQANRFYRLHQQKMFSELQNRDGSFSTAWFERPEDGKDVERQLRTTGHMLEFLVSTADQKVLYHPKTIAAVGFLAGILDKEPEKEWKIGPMSHSLHALAIYQERVWSGLTPDALAAYSGDMKAKATPMPPAPKATVFPVSLQRFQSLFR